MNKRYRMWLFSSLMIARENLFYIRESVEKGRSENFQIRKESLSRRGRYLYPLVDGSMVLPPNHALGVLEYYARQARVLESALLGREFSVLDLPQNTPAYLSTQTKKK